MKTRADGFVPARVAAERLGVTLGAPRVWAHRGILTRDRSRGAAKPWVKLTRGDATPPAASTSRCPPRR